jgi:hypothetical protein
VVERDLAKVDVAGSTPVSRSRLLFFKPGSCRQRGLFPHGTLAYGQGRGTQVVRERSAKPLCVGSIPTRASNLPLYFLQLLHSSNILGSNRPR